MFVGYSGLRFSYQLFTGNPANMAADVKDATIHGRIASGCRIVDCSDWTYLGVFVKNAGAVIKVPCVKTQTTLMKEISEKYRVLNRVVCSNFQSGDSTDQCNKCHGI
jgi:hypothetical protein